MIFIADNGVYPIDAPGNSTYVYNGQINTNPVPITIGSGWHDIEMRFGENGSSATGNLTGNLFNPGTMIIGPADTGSIPEPSALFLLPAVAPILYRRRLKARIA